MRRDTSTTAAFAIAILALGLVALAGDHVALLAEPRPDLDVPLVLIGIAAGLWSASKLVGHVPEQKKRWSWVLWIAVPLWLSFGLASLGERLQGYAAFSSRGVMEEATVLVVGKERSGRRSTRYYANVVNPIDESRYDIRVDGATFDQIAASGECVTLLVERGRAGAVRLVRPLEWKVRCPWVRTP